jgi:hypothetical protein
MFCANWLQRQFLARQWQAVRWYPPMCLFCEEDYFRFEEL